MLAFDVATAVVRERECGHGNNPGRAHRDPVVGVIEFGESTHGTLVTVTHGDNPSEGVRANHRTGWLACLDRLGRLEVDDINR